MKRSGPLTWDLGAFCASKLRSLRRLGPPTWASWANLGLQVGIFRVSWGLLGCILGPLSGIGDALGTSSVAFWKLREGLAKKKSKNVKIVLSPARELNFNRCKSAKIDFQSKKKRVRDHLWASDLESLARLGPPSWGLGALGASKLRSRRRFRPPTRRFGSPKAMEITEN